MPSLLPMLIHEAFLAELIVSSRRRNERYQKHVSRLAAADVGVTCKNKGGTAAFSHFLHLQRLVLCRQTFTLLATPSGNTFRHRQQHAAAAHREGHAVLDHARGNQEREVRAEGRHLEPGLCAHQKWRPASHRGRRSSTTWTTRWPSSTTSPLRLRCPRRRRA